MSDMSGDADIAAIARLLGDGTRAAMCTALLDGRYWTAGELARHASVARSTASEHLSHLVGAGLLQACQQGRHRYFRLAGPAVAAALEALAVLSPATPVRSLRQASAANALRQGRTCYDHLAGRLGIAMTDALITSGVITGEFAVRDLAPLAPLDLHLPNTARPIVRSCMDWTERQHHAAGALPAALTARLLQLGWLSRMNQRRAVRLTAAGTDGLAELLQLDVDKTATSSTPPWSGAASNCATTPKT